MCGGGGKGLSQSSMTQTQANPFAMMQYANAVNQVNQATSAPFKRYSDKASDYISPLTGTQTGAISNITGMAGMTDPYYGAAAALTGAGAQGVGRLTGQQIQEYMSPYMSHVIDPTRQAIQQQSGQQLAQQQAEAIKAGAFGGDRSGIQRQLLRGQQALGLGQALSPLYQTGYGQALQTAQGQQAIEQANLQRLLAAGQQIGGLGSAAQQAALQQAQAQLQAGTQEQQTATAGLQALYGEAQKERMYPLQAAAARAQGIASLGPLMGQQTTGYSLQPFFGGLAATGGAIHGESRMGGAVKDAGDYAEGGSVDDPEFPSFDIRASRPLEAQGVSTADRKGLIPSLIGAGEKASGLYEKAKGLGSLAMKAAPFLGLAEGGRAEYRDGGAEDDMDAYLRPLARIETGGEKDPYSALGPATKYGRALGKYQIMEGNVPEWSKAALGRALTREEFLGDPKAQEAIARHRFGQYLDKAGTPEEAAAMWFGGPGYKSHMGARDVLGTSIPQYMAKYKAGLGEPNLEALGPRERSFMALDPAARKGLGTAPAAEEGPDWERIGLSALSGLGAMAGSRSRYAGSALLEGLGAGAKSYLEVPKIQAETQKIREEALRTAAEAGLRGAEAEKLSGVDTQRAQAEIDAVRAGLYQTVVVPGEGVLLINKSNPQAGYTKIMEADGTPVPGKEHIATEINKQPGAVPPAAPITPTETAHPWETQPVTEPPKGFKPSGQATLALDERAAAEAKTRGYEEAEKARAAGSDASRNIMRIAEMEEAVKNLEEPKGGWMTKQGPWADQRLNLAKNINFLTSALTGKAPIPESEISSMEVLNKDAFRLGSSAVSALQGHPAQAIIQQSVVATPSLANTRMGYQRLLAGLKMAAQYEQDRGKFFSNYYNKFHNTLQAQEAFDKFNPPQEYARRAVASVIDPRHMEALKKYGANIKDKIDAIYGVGTTAALMGQ